MYLYALKQIFKITFAVVFFITLPAVIFTLVTSKTPTIYGIQSFVVMSGSMEPAIPIGSIIYTQKAASYKINDVIAFKQGKTTVTHRIVDIKKQGSELQFVTKGDANKSIDSQLVTESQIVGKNAYTILNAGKLIAFLRTIPGFLIILVLPTFIFIGAELWSVKNEYEKSLKKKIMKEFGLNFHEQV